jgi:hypothetical protein
MCCLSAWRTLSTWALKLARCSAASRAFGRLLPAWKSPLAVEVKSRAFKAMVEPMLFYGCEACARQLPKREERRAQAMPPVDRGYGMGERFVLRRGKGNLCSLPSYFFRLLDFETAILEMSSCLLSRGKLGDLRKMQWSPSRPCRAESDVFQVQ